MALLAIGADEPLVGGEPHQRQPEGMRLALDLLDAALDSSAIWTCRISTPSKPIAAAWSMQSAI